MDTAITASPHAFDPVAHHNLPKEEQQKVYRQRVNDIVKPYTVIDVLTKVYHRSFSSDLAAYIGKHPEAFVQFKKTDHTWGMSRLWVNECVLIAPESVFDQPKNATCVDIALRVRVKVEEEKKGNAKLKTCYTIKGEFRLRYIFNFCPCHLTCEFDRVIVDKKDSLLEMYPDAIRLDKYLLPLLLDAEDYRKAAALVRDWVKSRLGAAYDPNAPFDSRLWVTLMGPQVKMGVFPENGAMGEYFFNFGQADLIDIETGVVTPNSNINPGTIVLNQVVLESKGIENVTTCHEGCHHRFDFYYLMLQMTHGHHYASYLCKRYDKKAKNVESGWSPVDIMELHANKLPGYILIPDEQGKTYAKELLERYGGVLTLDNCESYISEYAEHFVSTFRTAKRRLSEFGYTQVDGIRQYVEDKRVPNHISNLPKGQVYSIDESDGIQEYIRNPEFRRIIDTGLFVYADNCYCLNLPQYVCADHSGTYHLKREARKNMSACCLVFEEKYQHRFRVVFGGRLFKNPGKGSKTVNYRGKNGEAATTAEGLALRKQMEKERQQMAAVRITFNQMTKNLMKSKGYSAQRLSIETGISEDTIKNMRNDPYRVFDMRELVAFCIALHLPPDVSKEYIDASLTKYKDTTDMMLYKYALRYWYKLPLEVVNRKLVESGAVPLTNLVEGFSEDGIKEEA